MTSPADRQRAYRDRRRPRRAGAVMAPTAPTFTVVSEHGHIEVTWPEPLAPDYPVSVELLREWADTLNRLADLRAAMVGRETVEVSTVLQFVA